MCIHFNFDFRKATQALNYLAIKFGGEINKMKAIKLIYFADRYHLRKYGRPVTNDEYVAMKFGPVASKTKDIAEDTIFLDDIESDYRKGFINLNKYNLLSANNVDMSVFSDSDMEALDFVLEHMGRFDQYQLADLSHAYPEWKRHEKELERGASAIDIDYEDFFKDPSSGDANLSFTSGSDLFAVEDEDKENILAYVKEQQKIKKLWERHSD